MRLRSKISPILILTVLCAISLQSCKTLGGAGRGIAGRTFKDRISFEQEYNRLPAPPIVESSGKAIFIMPDKSSKSCGMRWTSQRDEAFILSLRPMGIMEIGKLTITPKNMVLLDRYHKEGYDLGSPSLVTTIASTLTGYNPQVFKAIIDNDPFTFSTTGLKALRQMEFQYDEMGYTFRTFKHGMTITNRFDRNLNMIAATIYDKEQKEIASVHYKGFKTVSKDFRPYPTAFLISLRTDEGSINIDFNLSDLKDEMSQTIDLTIPDHYKKLGVFDLIKRIKSVDL